MAFNVDVATVVSSSGQNIADSVRYSGNSLVQIDRSFSSAPTNAVHEVSIDISELQVLTLIATANCTVKTNNTGSPDDTFTLVANQAYVWRTGINDPLDADITVLYITSESTSFSLRGIALSSAA
jgi:hypothetical protein